MELRITELLDEYREEDTLLQYTDVPDTDRIRKATMKKLSRRKLRPLRVGLIAAAVTVLLMGTVAGSYVSRHWDGLLENFFGVTEQQKEVVDEALQDVYVTAQQDGCTFTVTQVLGDEQCVLIAVEVTLPEGTELLTASQTQLQELAAQMDYSWEEEDTDSSEMVQWIERCFGCQAVEDGYVYGPRFGVLAYPTGDEAEYEDMIAQFLEEEDSGSLVVAGDNGTISMGILRRSVDTEHNRATMLFYMECDKSLPGQDCTILINHLWMEDLTEMLSSPDRETERTDLLTGPVELNFALDYEAQSREFVIQQEGEEIGSVTLSAFSAQFLFPQESDDPNRLAPNRVDYLGRRPEVSVKMKDGTLISLNERTSGFTDVQFGFFVSEEIIDLDAVDTLVLNDYTFVVK